MTKTPQRVSKTKSAAPSAAAPAPDREDLEHLIVSPSAPSASVISQTEADDAPPEFYEDGAPLPANFKPIPLAGLRTKLDRTTRAGFVRRWVNDERNRVQAARNAGYAFVKGKDGKPVTYKVDVKKEGGAVSAYYMEIPEPWYKEAQAEAQAEVDKIDRQIHGGNLEEQQDDKRYRPKGSPIDIRQVAGR